MDKWLKCKEKTRRRENPWKRKRIQKHQSVATSLKNILLIPRQLYFPWFIVARRFPNPNPNPSTIAPLAHILKATAIVLTVIHYIRSEWRAEPAPILSLKYHRQRVLAATRDTGPGNGTRERGPGNGDPGTGARERGPGNGGPGQRRHPLFSLR